MKRAFLIAAAIATLAGCATTRSGEDYIAVQEKGKDLIRVTERRVQWLAPKDEVARKLLQLIAERERQLAELQSKLDAKTKPAAKKPR